MKKLVKKSSESSSKVMLYASEVTYNCSSCGKKISQSDYKEYGGRCAKCAKAEGDLR